MINWGKSYTASWRVFRVNRKTWADADRIENVDSFMLSRTADGDRLESGSINVTGDFEPDYYRIVMTAKQGNIEERVNVATLLFDYAGGVYNRNVYSRNMDGFSVLYPASVTAVPMGGYAPAGTDGANYAKELLTSAINAPVDADGSFTLVDNVVHEMGSTVLQAVWSVLNAGNFVMQIDGAGIVHIKPMPKLNEPSLIIDTVMSDILTNGINFTSNMSEIPNRYIVIDDNIVTIASNNDEDSVVSIPNRGYTVDVIDTSPTLVNNQTYLQYAENMLKESSKLKEEKTYTREYAPDVYPYSVIKASIRGFEGDLRVQSQTINCVHGITVNETSYMEHVLYD